MEEAQAKVVIIFLGLKREMLPDEVVPWTFDKLINQGPGETRRGIEEARVRRAIKGRHYKEQKEMWVMKLCRNHLIDQSTKDQEKPGGA